MYMNLTWSLTERTKHTSHICVNTHVSIIISSIMYVSVCMYVYMYVCMYITSLEIYELETEDEEN